MMYFFFLFASGIMLIKTSKALQNRSWLVDDPASNSRPAVSFIDWPHIPRTFDGFIGTGDWLTSVSQFASPYSKDNITIQAHREGLFSGHQITPSDGSFESGKKIEFHIFSSEEVRECLLGKKLVILGDSYMMQMYIGLCDIFAGIPFDVEIKNGTMRSQILSQTRNMMKPLMKNTSITFELEECRHGHLTCFYENLKKKTIHSSDVVVMNALIHQLNSANQTNLTPQTAESHFYNYHKYLNLIFNMTRNFHDEKSNLKLTWCSGVGYSFLPRLQKAYSEFLKNGLQNNFNAFRLNFEAFKLAEQYNIPTLDILTMTSSCNWANCSSDGGHRARFVNRMKAQMLLNNICKINNEHI